MSVVCRTVTRQSNIPLAGADVQASRESVGLSREGLAYKAGVSLRTLERIESGDVQPRRATLVVIGQALAAEAEEIAA